MIFFVITCIYTRIFTNCMCVVYTCISLLNLYVVFNIATYVVHDANFKHFIDRDTRNQKTDYKDWIKSIY